MNNTITKFKWFWAWQDDKEEIWLSEMARAGWHLQSLNLPGFYTFVAGEPRDDVYRLDFVINPRDYQAYLQRFKDEGWEHVGRMGSWQYFRMEARSGHLPVITNEWKIAKYNRVLFFLVIFLPMWTVFLSRNGEPTLVLYEIAKFIGFLFFVVYTIAIVMIFQRMLQLKQS